MHAREWGAFPDEHPFIDGSVLAALVRARWREEELPAGMLAWLHSGLGAHVGWRIEAEDRQSLLRLARYVARSGGEVAPALRGGSGRGGAGVGLQ